MSRDWRKTTAYRDARAVVLARDEECHICGGYVDKTLDRVFGEHNKNCSNINCDGCLFHPMRAEVDHVTAVSRGGHGYSTSNLRLSHRYCNKLKGSRNFIDVRLSKEKIRDSVTGQVNIASEPSGVDWLEVIGGVND